MAFSAHTAETDWQQLEQFVERIATLAHGETAPAEFYGKLLGECIGVLAAEGGAVWQLQRGAWRAIAEVGLARHTGGVETANRRLIQLAAQAEGIQLLPPRSKSHGLENPIDAIVLLGPASADAAPTVIELFMRPGSSPAAQQGWQEVLATVCTLAGEFQIRDEIRTLRAERQFHGKSLALVARLEQLDLERLSYEVANEGRTFVGADRMSVVVRRRDKWRLLAASGADHVEPRGDAAKRLESLAELITGWGEPVEYPASDDLPPELASQLENHLDASHARRLAAAPLAQAVLVAESFTAASELSCQRVIELAELATPALERAARFDSFPMRTVLRWSDAWAGWVESWGVRRMTLAAAAAAAAIAALVLVPCDYEIEAPAILVPLVERNVFATVDGRVTAVHVDDGEQVAAGQILAELADPQLNLDLERVRGEIATIRKRNEAIAVARTDRTPSDDDADRLPLAAQAQQLELQLASLEKQLAVLGERKSALRLTSPIAGQVITLDVQHLLTSRPVERGQVLFTVADTTAGWELAAEVAQRDLGAVVTASQANATPLAARFRLPGQSERVFAGHVRAISARALLDPEELTGEAPAVEVRVTVDEAKLAAARPGMNAEVRIDCGRRSIGYVWLHDAWETVYAWLVF